MATFDPNDILEFNRRQIAEAMGIPIEFLHIDYAQGEDRSVHVEFESINDHVADAFHYYSNSRQRVYVKMCRRCKGITHVESLLTTDDATYQVRFCEEGHMTLIDLTTHNFK